MKANATNFICGDKVSDEKSELFSDNGVEGKATFGAWTICSWQPQNQFATDTFLPLLLNILLTV